MAGKEYDGCQLWIVIPQFSAHLFQVDLEELKKYRRAASELTSWVLAGNQFWIYSTQEEAEKAARALQEMSGPAVTSVYAGPCVLSREVSEELSGSTYYDYTDGYFVRLLQEG